MRESYSIDDLTLDVGARRVARGGEALELSGHALDLLIELARRSPDVVSTEVLMDTVWPDVVVGEENVKQQVLQLRRSLGDDAKEPRYVATVRGHGYQLIPQVAGQSAEPTPSADGSRFPWWTLAVAGLLLALLLLWRGTVGWKPGDETGGDAAKQKVLVETFDDLTGRDDLALLQFLFTDGLARRLAAQASLDIVPATAVGSMDHDERAPASSGSGAFIIDGQYYLAAEQLVVEASLTRADSGAIVGAIEPVQVAVDRPFEGLEALAARVRPLVAGSTDPFVVDIGLRAPADIEAYREYALGMEFHTRLDFESAVPHFERAAEMDPSFAAPRITLILALTNLDRRQRARAEVAKLEDAAPDLLPVERGILAVFDAVLHSDHERGLIAARALAAKSPSSPLATEAGRLALLSGHPREAVERLRPFVERPGPLQDFLPWHYYLTLALHADGRHAEEGEVATAARQRFGATWGTAVIEVRAAAGNGDPTGVERLLAAIGADPSISAERRAAIHWTAATEVAAHGRPDLAPRLAQAGVDLASEASERSALESFHLARLFYLAGDAAAARAAIAKAAGELPPWPEVEGWSQVLDSALGEPLPAHWRDRLRALADPEDPAGEAEFWIAALEAQRGNLEAARDALARATAAGFPLWGTARYRSSNPELHAHPLLAALQRPAP